jgi:hypothetical protein
MKALPSLPRLAFGAAFFCAAGLLGTTALSAAPKNPTSKFYVADESGDVQIDTGTKIDELTKHSVYNAEGSVIDTKPNSVSAMVFSNGTGLVFNPDTHVEIKRFQQEPFIPNRTDMDVEPSISQTQAFVTHGSVSVCTSKLVAGSSMTYTTPLGSVNIQGGQVVVQANNGQTIISMINGEASVTDGPDDAGAHLLRDGQQAVFTADPNGGPATMTIQPIPTGQVAGLTAMAAAACASKKTVYFETRYRTNSLTSSPGGINAFDGDDGATGNATPTGPVGSQPPDIVAIPTANSNVPVQFTVSIATLTSNPAGG